MKVFSLRVTVPLTTLPAVPAIFRVTLPGAVIKRVIVTCSASASLEQMGYKITNQGVSVFPAAGKGVNANEDGYAPFVSSGAGLSDVEIFETLDGPPYNIEVQCFNRTGAAIFADFLIFTDGKERSRQVEKIEPSDMVTNKLVD